MAFKKQLQMGIRVEMEHTKGLSRSVAKRVAEKIARDHIGELPDYYTRLKKMEREGDRFWKHKGK